MVKKIDIQEGNLTKRMAHYKVWMRKGENHKEKLMRNLAPKKQ